MTTMTQPPYRGPAAGVLWALLLAVPLWAAVAFTVWACNR